MCTDKPLTRESWIRLAVQFPSAMTATFAFGLLLALVGNLSLALAIRRDDRLPGWAGVLWGASAALFYLPGVLTEAGVTR